MKEGKHEVAKERIIGNNTVKIQYNNYIIIIMSEFEFWIKSFPSSFFLFFYPPSITLIYNTNPIDSSESKNGWHHQELFI